VDWNGSPERPPTFLGAAANWYGPCCLVVWCRWTGNGKVALIESAQAMGIQRYVFSPSTSATSTPRCPSWRSSAARRKYLHDQTSLNYTTIRLCGFMQVRPGYTSIHAET